MLIEEIEPEEAVIFARAAVHAEVEVRRHAQSSQNMPRCGDKQEYQDCAEWAQATPGLAPKKLARNCQINEYPPDGNHQCEQPFQQHPHAQCNADQGSPSAGVGFFSVLIHSALECQETNSDRERENYVGNKNAGKEEKTNRCRQSQSGIESGAASKGPCSVACRGKAEQD